MSCHPESGIYEAGAAEAASFLVGAIDSVRGEVRNSIWVGQKRKWVCEIGRDERRVC